MASRRFHHVTPRVLVIVIACVGLLALGARTAPARQTPSPSNALLSPEVQRVIRQHAARIAPLGCSAWILRNHKGIAVGAAFAAHCEMLAQQTKRYRGTDHHPYVLFRKPIRVLSGSSFTRLDSKERIDKVIAPTDKDFSHEVVIGVRTGRTSGEALRAYRDEALTRQEILHLKVGQAIYWGGYPVDQPRRPLGGRRRQSQEAHVLSLGQVSTQVTLDVQSVWTSVTPTGDGLVCGPGSSGAGAFVMVDGRPKLVGIVSAISDLKGNLNDGAVVPSLAGNEIAADCAIAYQLPPGDRADKLLRVVRSVSQIPGYGPRDAMSEARRVFQDPHAYTLAIDGIAWLGRKPGWVINPILINDFKHEAALVGWSDPTDPTDSQAVDHLRLHYFDKRDLAVNVYPLPDESRPGWQFLSGLASYDTASGDFVDNSGSHFGQISPAGPDRTRQRYVLLFEDKGTGALSVRPVRPTSVAERPGAVAKQSRLAARVAG
jgi:hypothetical protein